MSEGVEEGAVPYSKSLWKSCAVKSLRLGWPTGFREALKYLPTTDVRSLILAQVFEDFWPSRDQLPEVLYEVEARDIEALCLRDTHHGRGLSRKYLEIAPAVESRMDKDPSMIREVGTQARDFGLGWIARRALSEFAIWLQADPPAGGPRTVDDAPWAGMPPAMADMHTLEGRRLRTLMTILCGAPEGHVALMEEVQALGWASVRELIHAEESLKGDTHQPDLWAEGGK